MELVAGFDDFDAAARFGLALGQADGIAKKLVTAVAAPLPEWFRGLDLSAGQHVVLAMVAQHGLVPWDDLLRAVSDEAGRTPLYEYS